MQQLTAEKLPDLVKYLAGEMDHHNVQKSMIVAVEPVFPTELYLEAAKLAPERLMVACSVLPRPLNRATDQLKSYHERGAKALKLQPMQYDPQDPAVERLVYEAVKLRMPVLFHYTDSPRTFPPMLDHFANTFTDGSFVVIHFGGVYGFTDMLPLTRLPNVWLETSVAFPKVVNSPMRSALQFLVDEKRLDRLIFGSELPRDYETVCGAIDKLVGPNPDVAVTQAIYRGNADRLLRISLSSQLLEEEQQREKNANVPELFAALGVKEGSRIAEVGAGDGFWVVRLAAKVGPSGQVIGEDVNQEAIDRLGRRVREDELANVTVTHGETADPKLLNGMLDGVLIVKAYHEFKEPGPMLAHINDALKRGGRLVVIDDVGKEHRKRSRSELTASHEFTPELMETELRQAGFEPVERRDPFGSGGDRQTWMVVARRK
jgi:predicted TIM-barrel fold metal-dependent hydrolase/precorrin-6B methylase 2